MSLRIDQGFEYQGDDWWHWWVWIEGPAAELDRIEKVVYTLHETFPNPVQTIRDRATNFRLKTAGWGVFRIYAKVFFADGSTEKLQHDLELLYEDGAPTSA